MKSVVASARLRSLAIAAAAILTATTVGAPPAAAQSPVAVSRPAPLTVEQARGSVAYLRAAYGISEREALRRLELQRTSAELDAALSAGYPDDYAGMWLDQEAGGVLVLAATRPERVRSALRSAPDQAHLRTVKVGLSLRQLSATRDALSAELATDTNVAPATVVIDARANRVAVYQRAGAATAGARATGLAARQDAERRLVGAADTRLTAAVARHADRAVLRQLVAGKERSGALTRDTPVAAGCDPRDCAPPMRGGMRLTVQRTQASTSPVSLNPWWGQCTNGFNMVDSRGWNYVMTAGHCMTGTDKLGINYSYSTDRTTPVGTEVLNFENGPTCDGCSTYPADYSIQPYRTTSTKNWYTYWGGSYARNQVVSWCQSASSTWQGCVTGSYAIKGYYALDQVKVGWVVCGTGSGDDSADSGYSTNVGYLPGTRCGTVSAKDGGLVTNLCTRPGDSGGPLFSEIDGRAYGILHGGTDGNGPCPTSPAGTEWSNYSPISVILAHVQRQTLDLEGKDYGFKVRTTP
ncbi:hypothetical protein [Micromonospora coerulea]|uniref:hypothetical protein n=1 Tax=Micromonospora coerulea TaxID=47856 RepID=UPI001903C7CF|nr:hypothetical protein [Micromonospora veneta]